MQCVDLSNWFLDNYTTLGRVSGNGKDIVQNIANKHDLEVSTIPTAPSIYSVDGYHKALGTRGTTPYGHTGVIVDVKDNLDSTYTVTYLHTYSNLDNDGYISEFKEETITPNEKVTFVNIGDYISK